jgi:adenylate cyclase
MATTTRKLAAIMFTDIVGYTSLMGSDEKKAFDLLKKNRRIHWRLIKKYRGRFLKEMGDGTLASFSSSMDAVMCAISIQLAAEEMDIHLRIGIHQGDVVFEQKDVLGDGVNIASRIQGVAETQGIAISETVHQEIRNKEGLELVSVGTKNLKGAYAPMEVYKVSCTDPGILDYKVDTGELLKPISSERKSVFAGILIATVLLIAVYAIIEKTDYFKEQDNSVLVMPFKDFTGIDTLDYVAAGMHDAMITNIGRISGLRVLGSITANAYKNTDKSLPEIGRERDVKTIIEGALSCFGEDSICFTARVMEVYPKEKQLDVQNFKVARSQIPNLYNMVTKEFTKAIDLTLTPEDEKFLAESKTVNKEAYEAYLKAGYYYDQANLESIQLAEVYYNKAIEIDPNWAPPYVGLTDYWALIRLSGGAPDSVTIPKWLENIEMAKKLDPELIQIKLSEASFSAWTDFNWERGEQEFLNIIKINPNHALARSLYASLLLALKRNKEAIKQADQAAKLDPLNPMVLGVHAIVSAVTGEYKKAVELAEKAMTIAPNQNIAIGALYYSYFCMGEYRTALNYLVDWNDLGEETRMNINNAFDKAGFEKATLVAVEAIEASNWYDPATIADLYAISGKDSRAMDLIEQMYNDRNPKLSIYGSSIYTKEPFKIEDPRFNELLRKLNLPLN